jgi:hypothetical protein
MNWDEWAKVGLITLEADYPEGWTDDDRYFRYYTPGTFNSDGLGQKVIVWIPPEYAGRIIKFYINL